MVRKVFWRASHCSSFSRIRRAYGIFVKNLRKSLELAQTATRFLIQFFALIPNPALLWSESIYLSCKGNFYGTARLIREKLLTYRRADQKPFGQKSLKSDQKRFLSGFIRSLGGVLVFFNFRSKRNDFWGLRVSLWHFLSDAHFFDDLSSFSKVDQ